MLESSEVEAIETPETPEETQQFEQHALDLASLGANPKWKVIEEYMTDRIAFYKDGLADMDIKGADLAQVGEKYLVCSLVAMEFQGLLDLVRITTEAVSEARRKP